MKSKSRNFSKFIECIFFLTTLNIYTCNSQDIIKTNGSDNLTICNPLNINYRFCMDKPSRREAADPTIVLFKDKYYLFASKCGGYYSSTDLINWKFITTHDLDYHIEDYAPTVVVINDALYFLSSSSEPKVFKSVDPDSGKWETVNNKFSIPMIDPDLFLDDDGRLYFYYGCSDVEPIRGVELDTNTFTPKGKPVELFSNNKEQHGWERFGDFNEKDDNPWIEGVWMNKYNNKYYLQYACPGTQFKSYCDAVYVSENPLGPFKIARHNPFSYKPGGFISGAGHGSTFMDKYGNYWHIASMSISQKHIFERRLGIFPVFFDKENNMYAYTKYGDIPYIMPTKKMNTPKEIHSGWMLLSYKKPVKVSSELKEKPASNASDENIRTYWSAKTGNKGEWIMMDLKSVCRINAIQINFAEHNSQITGVMIGRDDSIYHQYWLEVSKDNKTWFTVADKRMNKIDAPHDYIEIPSAIYARYIRLTNYKVPDGTFAIEDLRVFGYNNENSDLNAPTRITVIRDKKDACKVHIKWNESKGATGYNISYGIAEDKLYHNYQVMGKTELTIGSLDKNTDYYFTIEAFNENTTVKSNKIIECKTK